MPVEFRECDDFGKVNVWSNGTFEKKLSPPHTTGTRAEKAQKMGKNGQKLRLGLHNF